MSHNVNTQLLELAVDHIDFWAGEGIGAAIEADIARNDLDALEYHLQESAGYMLALEGITDEMTDERAEAMYQEVKDA